MRDKYDITLAHAVSALGFTDFYGPDDALIFPEGVTPPTENEAETKLNELRADFEKQAYARSRASQYPSINDVVVALAEKEEGDDTMWKEITALRQKVKSDIPKPT